MNKFLASILLSLSAVCALAANDINPKLSGEWWPSRWISCNDGSAGGYGVWHFRKSFDLAAVPSEFVIDISADNRYILYVNGERVATGPAKGDLFNWNVDVLDIAPYLKAGRNVLAVEVWNSGDAKPIAQFTMRKGELLVQGNSDASEIVNTSGEGWVCLHNQAYSPNELTYYTGPLECVDFAKYPWGWERPGYDDSKWGAAAAGMQAAAKGARDYPGRPLVQTAIPQMEYTPQSFARVRCASGAEVPSGFLNGASPVTVPAGTKAEMLLDQGCLTTGYPVLTASGGRNATITLSYSESLYLAAEGEQKGDRNQIEGKYFRGTADKVICDGGAGRTFSPLWWRTWRYLKVEVQTGDEPLTINSISSFFSAYPFENQTTFEAKDRPELGDMLEIGWRTARLCAHETYMDCPYYEQLQYFGDTRIQAMVSMYNSSDSRLVKNALLQGHQSIMADGITQSRYPSTVQQFIPSFSLFWIGMGYDYWRYRGDEEFLKTLLPDYRRIISWYEARLKDNGSLGRIPFWFFLDWAPGMANGEPAREADGDSALQDLLFMIALDNVAQMEESFGIPAMAEYYNSLRGRVAAGFEKKYWDAGRGLYADTPAHRSFSQHTNAMAVLAGMAEGEKACRVLENTLKDKSLIQATIYFNYYVNLALEKAGMGDMYLDRLDIWKGLMDLGLTTWAERPEPSRSDCHAWGSSPNIEFFRIVLGIDSAAPGFSEIEISPSLGSLTRVKGSMPHPKGEISVGYTVNKHGKLVADITVPDGVPARFVWQGRTYPLEAGRQTIVIRKED